MITHEIHWFDIVRNVVMLGLGIEMALRPQTHGRSWQKAVGWILIGMVIVDVVIMVA
jgi:hypothetical protein